MTEVPVCSSAVAVMSDALLSDSDWEIVEPQPFSFSKKRSVVCEENQGHVCYQGTQGDATAAVMRRNSKDNIGGMLVEELSLRKWSRS